MYTYHVTSADSCTLRVFVVCLRVSVCRVWGAAQVPVGVCRTTSLQGTGYHVNYFTHTPPAKRATRINTRASTPFKNTPLVHAAPSLFLSPRVVPPSSRSHCLKASDINSPFCFQERLLYILINSTLSCEINWHSFNDFFWVLWGRSFVSACQRAASEIGLNVLSSRAPGVRRSKAAAPGVNVSSSQSHLSLPNRRDGWWAVGGCWGIQTHDQKFGERKVFICLVQKGGVGRSRGAVLYWPGQVDAFS